MPNEKETDTKDKKVMLEAASSADMVRTVSSDHRRQYANNVALGFSSWDMWIGFGELLGHTDKGQPIIEEHTRITMSLEHAKAFSRIFAANLAKFEEQAGEIRYFLISDEVKEEFEKSDIPLK
ncbi:MAG: DUF3467 domain-containing protein [Acidobacteria bacterium]|jgi:hypothetical protein|nr:DUF3467 domain-containing protein [Acidobacteriota bacterium]